MDIHGSQAVSKNLDGMERTNSPNHEFLGGTFAWCGPVTRNVKWWESGLSSCEGPSHVGLYLYLYCAKLKAG